MRMLALAVIVAACSGSSSSKRPAGVTDELVASTERVVAALTKVANDVDASADCAAATTALRGNKTQMQAVMADADRLEKQLSAADAATQQWFTSTYQPKMTAANEKMKRKAQACQGDAQFKAAFDEINSSH